MTTNDRNQDVDKLTEVIEHAVAYNYCTHTVPVDMSVPSGCPECHAMADELAAVVLAHLTAEGWAKGREEWAVMREDWGYGTRIEGGYSTRKHAIEAQYAKGTEPPYRGLVRRRVTDWEAAQ